MAVNLTAIANSATAISNAVQSGAAAYTAINQATQKPYNPVLQQYLPQQQQSTPPATQQKSNTLMYVAVGGVGLLVVGAIVFIATRKKKD